jgi:hypothetical protein
VARLTPRWHARVTGEVRRSAMKEAQALRVTATAAGSVVRTRLDRKGNRDLAAGRHWRARGWTEVAARDREHGRRERRGLAHYPRRCSAARTCTSDCTRKSLPTTTTGPASRPRRSRHPRRHPVSEARPPLDPNPATTGSNRSGPSSRCWHEASTQFPVLAEIGHSPGQHPVPGAGMASTQFPKRTYCEQRTNSVHTGFSRSRGVAAPNLRPYGA